MHGKHNVKKSTNDSKPKHHLFTKISIKENEGNVW